MFAIERDDGDRMESGFETYMEADERIWLMYDPGEYVVVKDD